jgi:2-dehydro-3-deoxyphosphooctonate aldolase (KDO 8-P synthase)
MINQPSSRPTIIVGPCVAESLELLDEVAAFYKKLSEELEFRFIFKASFDKANRTSIDSYRGPGMQQTCTWFAALKEKYGVPVLTDIHTPDQAPPLAEVCDVLQIPAFLCRQTDLLIAAVATGREVNVKKGQFMAPASMVHAVEKARKISESKGHPLRLMLTERGFCFGYGDLVVDMRSFAILAKFGVPVIFDITHSTQQPPASTDKAVSGANRHFAPLLARAAAATGYVDGFFFESHPNPQVAKSDAASQLNLQQGERLLREILPIMAAAKRSAQDYDRLYQS